MPDNGLGSLERLDNGETLRLKRRRLGETQAQAAERLGVDFTVYGRWERGDSAAPRARLGKVQDHERCLIYRLRANFTQQRVANDLKRCRWWINMLERGKQPCDELLWYWEQ